MFSQQRCHDDVCSFNSPLCSTCTCSQNLNGILDLKLLGFYTKCNNYNSKWTGRGINLCMRAGTENGVSGNKGKWGGKHREMAGNERLESIAQTNHVSFYITHNLFHLQTEQTYGISNFYTREPGVISIVDTSDIELTNTACNGDISQEFITCLHLALQVPNKDARP